MHMEREVNVNGFSIGEFFSVIDMSTHETDTERIQWPRYVHIILFSLLFFHSISFLTGILIIRFLFMCMGRFLNLFIQYIYQDDTKI